ncbi:MAG: HAD family hydrolase [Anaerolineaceae bacterium]|nr:HAD family hydrolase [Anaerolineaceae bacterium]
MRAAAATAAQNEVPPSKKKVMKKMPDRSDAWDLVCEFVQDDGLRRHMLAVSAAMGWYANELNADVAYWETVGLLHDFDWEIHPDLDQHPIEGSKILRERGWDEETIRVILSHYTEGTGVPREKPIDFALLACDEITGLVIATTLVRPSKNIAEVKLSSIRKKWKNPRFAAGVDRDHVQEVTADFSRECFAGSLELWTHIQNVLKAMQGAAEDLELDGRLAQVEA